MKVISIVKDFSPHPYGRDEVDAPSSNATGKRFREDVLAKALREYDHVQVDLNGYNRYGPSFLDEAFGGLVRESGFTPADVKDKLTYCHTLESIEGIIKDRLEASFRDFENKKK